MPPGTHRAINGLRPDGARRRAIRVRRLCARSRPAGARPGDPRPIAVGPQVFDLLVYLVQNREHVVSKDDLLDAVWGGRIVSESTLTSHINAVRKAIGDSGGEQRLIRTIARKGFRFVGDVREVESSDGVAPPSAEPAGSTTRRRRTVPSRQAVDRRPAVPQSERRSRAGLFRRRRGGGHHHRLVAHALAVRDRAQLQLHLQGPRGRREAGRPRARRALRARRQRAQGGEPGAHHRPAGRRDHRGPSLGRAFRRHARRHLRAAGPDRRRASSARSRRSWSARRSSAPSTSRPKVSMPTTTTCAAWRTCIRAAARPSPRRCRCSTRPSSSIRNSPRPTAWPPGAISGARSMAG